MKMKIWSEKGEDDRTQNVAIDAGSSALAEGNLSQLKQYIP
jgi:hypothetical protein